MIDITTYFDKNRIQTVKNILNSELIYSGMYQAILTDLSGNIIAQQDSGDTAYDAQNLAVLAASNIGSLAVMSSIIGEKEFPMFILKGERDNIHFNKVTDELFLITLFNRELSLAFVRKRIECAVESIRELIRHCAIPDTKTPDKK
jgi:predicted regulator of Ras-like GTPase activity (Roadblock/LC7/MglB family)